MKMSRSLSKFILTSLDDVIVVIAAIAILYLFFSEYFVIGTILIVIGFVIFLFVKARLILPYLEDKGMISYDVVGKIGRVIEQIDKSSKGKVIIGNEIWHATSINGNVIEPGQQIRVIKRDGLILYVKTVD
ncbi:MAG: NfeD family protein [Candidatus Asgardarchaeia archaeon]